MNYTDDATRFAVQGDKAIRAAAGVDVVMGIGLYKQPSADQAEAQLVKALQAGAHGVAVFSYRSLFGDSPDVPAERRDQMRQAVGGWIEAVMTR